ncbi:hypothetical protein FC65_GL001582 [Ligilactobacillus acidipiscis DSM 15836]|uniref:Uncharacterized protein n=1 Tax=Ligilactobacillus acidipiscis DSM 15836 TaxID=1423716 RepID=A0ABR5PHD1_9LACO|nr:hypothetical protein FC65_GL001582 [Ligilactobacillus acidipiscis DSM 15836]
MTFQHLAGPLEKNNAEHKSNKAANTATNKQAVGEFFFILFDPLFSLLSFLFEFCDV